MNTVEMEWVVVVFICWCGCHRSLLLLFSFSFIDVVVVVVCVRRCHLHKYLCTNKNIPEYIVLCSCAHLLVRFCGAVSSLLIIINWHQEVDAAKGGWGRNVGFNFYAGGKRGWKRTRWKLGEICMGELQLMVGLYSGIIAN